MVNQLSAEQKIQIISEMGGKKENILSIFLELQKNIPGGFIDQETAALIGEQVGLSETRVYELLTYYAMTKIAPQPKFRFKVCGNTPCHFTSGDFTAENITEVLGITPGQQTEDGLFSFEYIPCFGACDLAPAIKVNEEVHGNMTKEKFSALVKELKTKA